MQSYEFTLVLDGPRELTAELEDALFEAGCDDGLLGFRDGSPFVDFIREADSLEAAVVHAIRQVRSLQRGIDVIRVEPDELVTATDIARRAGRTRESVRLLVAGQRGPGGFPPPIRGIHSRVRLWRWSEVAAWFVMFAPQDLWNDAASEAQFIAVVNAALHLQRNAPNSPSDLLERLSA